MTRVYSNILRPLVSNSRMSSRRWIMSIAEVRDNLTIQATRIIRPAPKQIDSFQIISPSESEMKVIVPLSNESFPLRLKYRTASGRVRVGRILEDLDTIAGIASYKHNIQIKMKMVVFHFKLLQPALMTSDSMSHFTSTRLAMICS